MKHNKKMFSVFLALLSICALISSSTNIIAALKDRDDGYKFIDIGPIELDRNESPKPSDTTVTEKPKPTDTTESAGLMIRGTAASATPKTVGISAVKFPKTADDVELFACVLMLLISCLSVMGLVHHSIKKSGYKYRS
jgi:hypothetical protein